MSTQTYFLGANSVDGFFSCYDDFCRLEDETFLWVIKGGPGCGKSSFMRKIGRAAEEKGLDVEYVICSGDPESLDGVYIPQLKLAYTDGTAPHVQEVQFPAVRGAYLDLGQFYDQAKLTPYADEIISVNKNYKSLYAEAYKALSKYRPEATCSITLQQNKRRLHAAISCRGIVYCDFPCKSVTVEISQLQEKIESFENGDIIYLHPLWPNVPVAVMEDGIIYHTPLHFPDCSEAIRILGEAKALHDQLESIYNPHVNFDAVYSLAQEHIKKYL